MHCPEEQISLATAVVIVAKVAGVWQGLPLLFFEVSDASTEHCIIQHCSVVAQ